MCGEEKTKKERIRDSIKLDDTKDDAGAQISMN